MAKKDKKSVGEVKSITENNDDLERIQGEAQERKQRISKKMRAEMEQAEQAEKLERLYTGESFEPLVRLPMDIPLAITGNPIFAMEEKEIKTLSVSCAETAKYFVKTDPRWLVLGLFLTNALMIYGGRSMTYFYEKAQAKKEALKFKSESEKKQE